MTGMQTVIPEMQRCDWCHEWARWATDDPPPLRYYCPLHYADAIGSRCSDNTPAREAAS